MHRGVLQQASTLLPWAGLFQTAAAHIGETLVVPEHDSRFEFSTLPSTQHGPSGPLPGYPEAALVGEDMSIDKLKKQSKNLLDLLPAFIQTHAQGVSLSSCQELVAQISGYPNWHAAQQRLTTADSDQKTGPSIIDPAVSQHDGKTFGRLPDAQGEISMEGADAETAAAMRGYLRKVHEKYLPPVFAVPANEDVDAQSVAQGAGQAASIASTTPTPVVPQG